MSVVDDVRSVIQDFLTPEMRELKVRIDALERRFDRLDSKVDNLGSRMDRLESKVDSRFDRLEYLLSLSERVARRRASANPNPRNNADRG
jgi:predicted nuclease with TOPRIM domain